MLSKLREHDRIDWSRASIDSASVASPGGQETGPNTTDRGKLGSTRHLVVDAQGIPLALTVTGANRHDSMAFEATLDALVAVPGLRGRPRKRQDKLHADKGYDFERCRRYLKRRGILVAADPSGSTHWATAEMHSSRPSDFGYHLMARISTGRIPMIVSHRDDGFRPVCASELGTR
jgi:hypothetical protein